jgi:hypothetical protein
LSLEQKVVFYSTIAPISGIDQKGNKTFCRTENYTVERACIGQHELQPAKMVIWQHLNIIKVLQWITLEKNEV